MDNLKRIVLIISIILASILSGIMFYIENKDNPTEVVIENAINQMKDVIVSEETKELAEDTIEAVKNNEDVSTSGETATVNENQIESDAIIDQENISYNGDITGDGLTLVGAYQGLTYYSQADSRWANTLYTSTGNKTQTMKSSACGPTSAAMVVSSSKGAILPTTMASLFVSNGYRTANNGTAWSAYSFVADYFGFKDYANVSSLDSAINYLNKGYFVIASCGSGLFTSNGHYIVLTGIEGNTIKIYDPYLYNGKFNTVSRKGKVSISGNTVYCSVSNFRNYANYKQFWCYSNDKGNGNKKIITNTSYTRYVSTQSSNLNVRASAGGNVVTSLKKGTAVIVTGTSGTWSKISSPVAGYVSSAYLSASPVITSNQSTTTKKVVTRYKIGTYTVTSNIHVRSGAGTKYTAKSYKQLTSNARLQNKKLGNGYYNGYLKGVVCKVTKISGNWGYTASGWICLDYCK